MNNRLENLMISLIKAEEGPATQRDIDNLLGFAEDELSIYDAESGADRECGYCPERSFDHHYLAAEQLIARNGL